MKQLLLILLVLLSPVIAFPQQKNILTPQQQEQFKKQMEEFQQQMKDEVKALQDSVTKLREELSKREGERMKGWEWSFHNLVPEIQKELKDLPEVPCPPHTPSNDWENLQRDHQYYKDWNFGLNVPSPPESPRDWNFDLHIPELNNEWFHVMPREYHLEIPRPLPPEDIYPYYRNHRHRYEDLLEMLPFYNLFKS